MPNRGTDCMAEPSSAPTDMTAPGAAARKAQEAVRASIDSARDIAELAAATARIRAFVADALATGDPASAITRRISELNDLVTAQLVRRTADELGLDLGQACWLAFGSQGRSEQTLATDQDNGIVFESNDPAQARARWLELGERVNHALDACGFPLCRGQVMAGQPDCCLTAAEWCARFDRWMEHGSPKDLLNASIYFDVRALVGQHGLVTTLRDRIRSRAAELPRFIKQLAENALCNPVALNWFGSVRATRHGGQAMFDLKMQGTALFVEAARLYALAQGIGHVTATDERLVAVARALHVPTQECEVWCHGFEILQRLRLRLQVQARSPVSTGNPNLVALDMLDEADLALLTKALHAARLLQQRIALDYRR
jgi:CBS domain-containing protein